MVGNYVPDRVDELVPRGGELGAAVLEQVVHHVSNPAPVFSSFKREEVREKRAREKQTGDKKKRGKQWERIREISMQEREIERDFYFFESASGRFEPTTPV